MARRKSLLPAPPRCDRYVSRSVLSKRLSWRDDGTELICRAEMAALTGTLQTVRTLSVQREY